MGFVIVAVLRFSKLEIVRDLSKKITQPGSRSVKLFVFLPVELAVEGK